MGDSGSTFLGLVLFYIIFSKNDLNSSLIYLSTASPLIMDSCICILRRFINNENIFSPHKNIYIKDYIKKECHIQKFQLFMRRVLLL